MRRMERVIRSELTELQRDVLLAVYFGGKTQAQIAQERGVSRSTVCRTLHRAENRLRRFLRYWFFFPKRTHKKIPPCQTNSRMKHL